MRKLFTICLSLSLIGAAWGGTSTIRGQASPGFNSHGPVLNGVDERAAYRMGGMPAPATAALVALSAVLIRRR